MEQVVIVVEANHINKEELEEVLRANPQVFEEQKAFLFVSEEGEDVKEGDTWYDLYTENQVNISAGTIKRGNVDTFSPNFKNVLRFIDYDNALEASLDYRKLVTVKELRDLFNSGDSIRENTAKLIIEKVQSVGI